MSLFFKSNVATEINGYNPSQKDRSVFLDVQTKTPNFEKTEDGIKYKNYAGYPPIKKDAFEEKPYYGSSVRLLFYFLLNEKKTRQNITKIPKKN